MLATKCVFLFGLLGFQESLFKKGFKPTIFAAECQRFRKMMEISLVSKLPLIRLEEATSFISFHRMKLRRFVSPCRNHHQRNGGARKGCISP
mmetsp:Transcript_18125/g.59553  ORF Transcript_18125/g.59553 Transcript_18125/m.59553 type:complete len:92 (-) Transcript_18125:898-1173(-)